MSLEPVKGAARKAAFARRKAAFEAAGPGQAGVLSEFLAGHRGVPVSGFMPINSEINPLPAMAEAAAYGPVGVPVIRGKGQPLVFSAWEPDCALIEGPFRALVPAVEQLIVPEIVIVPLVAFDRQGGRLGYGGGFYDRTLEGLRARGAVLAIGFAFGAQEATDLPLEPTDQPLDLVITEADVIEVAPR
ncbi:MAG: 5-formyltetrahydrofolate cyclo-ligase [Pseudomonadota bacterium]